MKDKQTTEAEFDEAAQAAVMAVDKYLRILDRSHRSLHVVLARIYVAHLKAIEYPEMATATAASIGVKVARPTDHPLALLVIKLAFNNVDKKYDLRRQFSSWAVALDHMAEVKVSAEHAYLYLEDIGVHRCGKMYKAAHTDGETKARRQKVQQDKIKTYLSGQPRIGQLTRVNSDDQSLMVLNSAADQVALTQGGRYVLLLGELDGDGKVVDLKVVERDMAAITRYLLGRFKASTANDNQAVEAA